MAAKKTRVAKKARPARRGLIARIKRAVTRPAPRKKDVEKLRGRLSLDFAAVRGEGVARREIDPRIRARSGAAPADQPPESNPALLRLKALQERDRPTFRGPAAPVDAARTNWTPMGPLAVPNGQTYGGGRVLISGRVTAIAPHPTDGNTIYIGTSRGGVW